MILEISPEPTPEEREAVLQALVALEEQPSPSAWWQAGARESVEDEEEL